LIYVKARRPGFAENEGISLGDISVPDGSASAHLYRPKLLTLVGESYSRESFRSDIAAALTVAIVALPLSMAIAVASGVPPERGLYAAIVGGFIVSALGGSRFQIGGPAGAFIVLVSATVDRFGVEGLLLTVLLSGLFLTAVGFLRLGALVRYIPHAVTAGFTCGIALTIFASQLKELAGTNPGGGGHGDLLSQLTMFSGINPAALVIGIATAAAIFALQWWRPRWPAMLIAVVAGTGAAAVLHLSVETIASRFGNIPSHLPLPSLPNHSLSLVLDVLPNALSFTLLGGIESLLSAKIADGMTGRKHRYNMELVAQGIANIASALFGGISVTGTIARTATNIRAGARSPLSGIMHSGFLCVFLLFGAQLIGFIPLAALAGVLVVVSWNMIEKGLIVALLRNWRSALVLGITFGLTVMINLTAGILVGCLASIVLDLERRLFAGSAAKIDAGQ
jgi:SulP family sulfate permease